MGAPTQDPDRLSSPRRRAQRCRVTAGCCSLVLRQVYLGLNPYLKPWAVRLTRILRGRDGQRAQWYPEKAPDRARGANRGCRDLHRPGYLGFHVRQPHGRAARSRVRLIAEIGANARPLLTACPTTSRSSPGTPPSRTRSSGAMPYANSPTVNLNIGSTRSRVS